MLRFFALALLFTVTPVFAGESIQLMKSGSFRSVTHDPQNIWQDGELKPFAPEKGQVGADITEYRAKGTNGSMWLVSQILSEDCSLQLCPARLVKISADGSKKLLVDDMMHIGGPFVLSGKTLINGDYRFKMSQP